MRGKPSRFPTKNVFENFQNLKNRKTFENFKNKILNFNKNINKILNKRKR